MTRVQQKRRDRLVAKHQAALAHWPSRSGPEFTVEMQTVVRELETLALQMDSSSENTAERKHTWELVHRARADLGPSPPAEPKSFVDLLQKLQGIYADAVEDGKVPQARQELLNVIMERLAPEVTDGRRSEHELRVSRSKLGDLMRSMSHVLTDPSEGGPPLSQNCRAGQVWRELSRLKLALFQEVSRPFLGTQESEVGFDLLLRCSRLGTSLYKSREDDALVRRFEAEVVRPLARESRMFALRDHLMFCRPALPVSAVVPDPNAVFFGGADRTRSLLLELCRRRELVLKGCECEPRDPAQARWDRLRESNICVFDLNSEIAPVCYELGMALALGTPVIVTISAGARLPFDIDVEPVRLEGNAEDEARLAEALDHALYGWQRTRVESSVAASLAHLRDSCRSDSHFAVRHFAQALNDEANARDAVAARRAAEAMVGAIGSGAPEMIFPTWPASYPDPARKRCFHVTPFGPEWANRTMEVVRGECQRADTEYIRGDRALDPSILRSIWNSICSATHIVVDLTGLNPNVALELGIARALGKNVLLVSQDPNPKQNFPTIAKVRIHRYRADDDGALKDAVSRFLKNHSHLN